MRKLIAGAALAAIVLLAVAGTGTLQRVTVTTSEFSREALTNETAAQWQQSIGLGPNFYVTNYWTNLISFFGDASTVSNLNASALVLGTVPLARQGSWVVNNTNPVIANLTVNGFLSGQLLLGTNVSTFGLTATNVISPTYSHPVDGITNAGPFTKRVWEAMPQPARGYSTFAANINPNNDGANYRLTATNVIAIAQYWATNGMLAAGWRWMHIDDGWMATNRDANGNFQAHTNFLNDPSVPTMAEMVRQLHALGFKVSIYSSFNTVGVLGITCFGLVGTTMDTVQRDVSWFAAAGFDGIFFDSCGNAGLSGIYSAANAANQPPAMRAIASAVAETGRPMAVEFTVVGGAPAPYSSGALYWEVPYLMNIWPASGVQDFAGTFLPGVITQMAESVAYATFIYSNSVTPNMHLMIGAGHTAAFGDNFYPVLNGASQMRAYFSMLAITGTASRSGVPVPEQGAGEISLAYLTNAEVGAVCDDAGGICGFPLYSNNLQEVWIKPLGWYGSRTNAVVLVNLASTNQSIGFTLTNLPGVLSNDVLFARDLWGHSAVAGVSGGSIVVNFTNTVSPTNVAMFVFSPAGPRPFFNVWNTNFLGIGTATPQARVSIVDGVNGANDTVNVKSVVANEMGIWMYANADTTNFALAGTVDQTVINAPANGQSFGILFNYANVPVARMWSNGGWELDSLTAAGGTNPGPYSLSIGGVYQQATNVLSTWPRAPSTRGGFAFVSSNGYPYILLSTNGSGGSLTWTGTNKLGW